MGNKLLTLLSNIFTDLNLTDMESCYKVFKREVINEITIQEERFGFEPEIIAKISQKRVRIFESGISYYGRTYAEGKKIGIKDGWRALYCILKYNVPQAPLPLQFAVYSAVCSTTVIVNGLVFLLLLAINVFHPVAVGLAFIVSVAMNYYVSMSVLFRRNARWGLYRETLLNCIILVGACIVDLALFLFLTKFLHSLFMPNLIAATLSLGMIYLAYRFILFPEPTSPDW